MRQIGPIVNAARVAYEENFPARLIKTHEVARYIEACLLNMGLKMEIPVHTSMLFLDLKSAGIEEGWVNEEGARVGLKLGGSRIVVHHQIEEDAVAELLNVFRTVLQKKADGELVYTGKKPKRSYGKPTVPTTPTEETAEQQM